MALLRPPKPPAAGVADGAAHPDRGGGRESGEPPAATASDLLNEVQASNANELPSPRGLASRRRAAVAFVGDRRALVLALGRRDEGAAVALFQEYAPVVERTIGRILGVDDELADATQEVFMRALRSVSRLRDPEALTDWLLQITVCTATDWLRRRQRRRWLLFFDPSQLDHPHADAPSDTAREAVRATYRVLDRLGADERTVFALRFIDGMELAALARACGCSLATIKRRLGRATARFQALAKRESALEGWLGADARADEEEGSA